MYGLSETGFLTGLKDKDHTDDHLTSCGLSCPGIEIQVTDELADPIEDGRKGELVTRSSNVMRGYWNKEGETTAAFRNGFFRTGDVVYQDINGYFYRLDRSPNVLTPRRNSS